jgi:GNAT superfamily N-acetyltransferase
LRIVAHETNGGGGNRQVGPGNLCAPGRTGGQTRGVPDPSATRTVTVLPTEALTPALRRGVIDLCNAANDTDLFHELFVHIPSGGRHVLVHEGDRLVSHSVATMRHAQPEGHPVLDTAYLDAVATLPEAQHRGHGSAAVGRLAREITDYEIGCLQTDVGAFYEQLGWELWRGPLAGRGDDGLIPTPDQTGVMVLRLPRTPPLDLDGLLTIEPQPSRIWE